MNPNFIFDVNYKVINLNVWRTYNNDIQVYLRYINLSNGDGLSHPCIYIVICVCVRLQLDLQRINVKMI